MFRLNCMVNCCKKHNIYDDEKYLKLYLVLIGSICYNKRRNAPVHLEQAVPGQSFGIRDTQKRCEAIRYNVRMIDERMGDLLR